MLVKVISTLLLLFISIAAQTSIQTINQYIASQKMRPVLKHAQWSLFAVEAKSGRVILDFNSQYALAPASCLKLITTGIALKILGPEFKFETDLLADGAIQNGVLTGNVIIKGGGDPTLGSNQVAGSLPLDLLMLNWTAAIRKPGIKKISGNIIADVSLFDRQLIPDNWFWVDIGNYYGASSPALTIHDNLYYLTFKPGLKVGDPAKILNLKPSIEGLHFENHVKTGEKGSGDNAYIYCAPETFEAKVMGTIPAGVDSFTIKGSIPDPPLLTAQILKKFLQQHGIKITGKVIKSYQPFKSQNRWILTQTFSPPLKHIIELINKKSINLYCELLVKTLAAQQNGLGSTKAGLKIIKNELKSLGINIKGLHLSDGSGLARTNSITPRIMVYFLKAMMDQVYFDDFFHSLSLAGDPDDIGYFKNWGKGTALAKNARIKSGFIEGVRSHAGYLRTKTGKWIIFSFIANNFEGHYLKVDKIHEKILIMLSNQL